MKNLKTLTNTFILINSPLDQFDNVSFNIFNIIFENTQFYGMGFWIELTNTFLLTKIYNNIMKNLKTLTNTFILINSPLDQIDNVPFNIFNIIFENTPLDQIEHWSFITFDLDYSLNNFFYFNNEIQFNVHSYATFFINIMLFLQLTSIFYFTPISLSTNPIFEGTLGGKASWLLTKAAEVGTLYVCGKTAYEHLVAEGIITPVSTWTLFSKNPEKKNEKITPPYEIPKGKGGPPPGSKGSEGPPVDVPDDFKQRPGSKDLFSLDFLELYLDFLYFFVIFLIFVIIFSYFKINIFNKNLYINIYKIIKNIYIKLLTKEFILNLELMNTNNILSNSLDLKFMFTKLHFSNNSKKTNYSDIATTYFKNKLISYKNKSKFEIFKFFTQLVWSLAPWLIVCTVEAHLLPQSFKATLWIFKILFALEIYTIMFDFLIVQELTIKQILLKSYQRIFLRASIIIYIYVAFSKYYLFIFKIDVIVYHLLFIFAITTIFNFTKLEMYLNFFLGIFFLLLLYNNSQYPYIIKW